MFVERVSVLMQNKGWYIILALLPFFLGWLIHDTVLLQWWFRFGTVSSTLSFVYMFWLGVRFSTVGSHSMSGYMLGIIPLLLLAIAHVMMEGQAFTQYYALGVAPLSGDLWLNFNDQLAKGYIMLSYALMIVVYSIGYYGGKQQHR